MWCSRDSQSNWPTSFYSFTGDAPERSHHDAISYYGDDTNEYCLHVRIDEDEGIPYIEVKLNLSDEEIVIENGHWYFV